MGRISQANRGQAFEQLVNIANEQYRRAGVALIHKRPTPVRVLKSKGTQVLLGFYEAKSTVDYDGVYRGRAIYFEAKSTRERNRFRLDLIREHQLKHMEEAERCGAICFFLIEFVLLRKVFFVPFGHVRHWVQRAKQGGRKSIPLDELEVYAYEVKRTRRAVLDYLVCVDRLLESAA